LQWVRQLPQPRPAWPASQPWLRFDLSYSPVAAGKRLLVPSMVTDSVTAYDTETGAQQWRFYADGPVRLAPVADGGKVYFGSDDGYLYCLDAAKGTLLWRFRGGPSDRRVLGNERLISTWPVRGGPVLYRGTVYFTAGIWPFMGIFVHAVDAETGKVIWTNSGQGSTYTVQPHDSPAFGGFVPCGHLVANEHGLIAPGGRTPPACYDLKTGELRYFSFGDKASGSYHVTARDQWFFLPGTLARISDGAPISGVYPQVHDENALYSLLGGQLAAQEPQTEDKLIEKTDRKGQKVTTRVSTLRQLWKLPVVGGTGVTPVAPSGQLFLKAGARFYLGTEGTVAALEANPKDKAAKVVWRGSIEGTPWSMLAADEKLFVVTTEGRIYCFGGKLGEPRTYPQASGQWAKGRGQGTGDRGQGSGGRGQGPEDSPKSEIRNPKSEIRNPGVAASSNPWKAPAEGILQLTRVSEGYCLVLGLGTGGLAEALVRGSKLHLIAIDPDAKKVEAFRRRMDDAGLYGTRVTAHVGNPVEYALPPYLASLIVSQDLTGAGLEGGGPFLSAVFDALRPYGGVACLQISAERLEGWLGSTGTDAKRRSVSPQTLGSPGARRGSTPATRRLSGARLKPAGKSWSLLVREGPLPGAADWTHNYADAANSVVSQDRRVKAPLGLLWFGGPANDEVLPRHGHGPSPQVAAGRLLIEGRDMLRALDVYTGRLLWQKRLPNLGKFYDVVDHQPGAGEIGSNYVSLEDAVYVAYSDAILELDPTSGETTREFKLEPAPDGQRPNWGYLAASEDLLIATAVPVSLAPSPLVQTLKKAFLSENKSKFSSSKFGERVAGVERSEPPDPRHSGGSLALDPGHPKADQPNLELLKLEPSSVGQMLVPARYSSASRRLVVIDRKTGQRLWDRDATYGFRHNNIAVGAGKVFCIDAISPAVREALIRRGRQVVDYLPRLMAFDLRTGQEIWSTDKNVFGTFLNYSAECDVLLQAGSAAHDRAADEANAGMVAYRGKDGQVLWKNLTLVHEGPCMLHHDTIITQGPAYSLLTGEPKSRIHPLTGSPLPWKFTRNYGCDTAIASDHLLTFRSAAAGFYDLTSDGGTGNLGGFKSGCTSNLIVAGGLLSAPEYTRTCDCRYQNQTSLALIHDPEAETWTFNAFAWDGQPVRRVGINFGAPGDRLAADGTLWLDYPSLGGPSPDIPVRLEPTSADYFRYHSSRVRADPDRGELNWVAASGVRGVRAVTLTLAKNPAPPRKYTVRLHFAEVDDLQPGRRVFNVSLQDRPVLEGLDVVKLAGGTNRALVAQFTAVEVTDKLKVSFSPCEEESLPPVLCGIELAAEGW